MPTKTKVRPNRERPRLKQSVDSTCLRRVEHDDSKERLTLEFRKSGAVYAYDGVTRRTATSLVNASSIGRKFNKSIRNNYPYERLRKGTPKRGAKKHR